MIGSLISRPEPPARDGGALCERAEFGPDDIRIHTARSDMNAEAAVDAGHDVVATDEIRIPLDAAVGRHRCPSCVRTVEKTARCSKPDYSIDTVFVDDINRSPSTGRVLRRRIQPRASA